MMQKINTETKISRFIKSPSQSKNFIGGLFIIVHMLVPSSLFAKDLVKFCREATPQLDCDAMPKKELKALRRLCKEASQTLSPWSGFGIGAFEKKDHDGGLSLILDNRKQGSANGRTPCPHVQVYRYPHTENDVVDAINEAKNNGWKVKAVGAAHTDNELICAEGMALSNRFMNKIFDIELFEDVETVRAQPGVTIRQLGEWLHQRRKSLGYAIVGYEAVTIGGVIGTGAHGSSVIDSAILSDSVQSLRLVGGDGDVYEITRGVMGENNPDLWRALVLNLGVMGVVTEMRLRIREDFQLFVTSEKLDDDLLFMEGLGIEPYIEQCDTASFHWFPERANHKGRIYRNCGQAIARGEQSWAEFSANVDEGAQYTLHAPEAFELYYDFMKVLLHRGSCDSSKHFAVESIRRFDLHLHPPYGRKRTVPIPGISPIGSNPSGITGWSFAMQNSVGTKEGNEYRQTDWEVVVPVKKSAEVFKFLREFMNGNDPSYEKPFPVQSVGFFIRFSKASTSLLSHAAVGGDFAPDDTVMFLELSEFLPNFDAKNMGDKKLVAAIMNEYERPFRIFVTEMIKRFGARVHWAKNRQELFVHQMANADRHAQISTFAQQIKVFDPHGLFSNAMSDAIFSVAQSVQK